MNWICKEIMYAFFHVWKAGKWSKLSVYWLEQEYVQKISVLTFYFKETPIAHVKVINAVN